MKKRIAGILMALLVCGMGAQEIKENNGQKILLIYEESNKNIDPWIAIFKDEFERPGVSFRVIPAKEASKTDVSSYDVIVIYGAVMAFATKEPVRDWLDEGVDMNGKKIALFVTANRWFLAKYTGQLLAALRKNGMEPIDVVSAATKTMNGADKRKLVNEFAQRTGK